jgi:hypothetical protein
MGRKKIQIKKIEDPRNRQATFAKRKTGLLKKAMELSLLCDCEIAMIVFNLHDKPIQYSSRDMDLTLFKFCDLTDQRKPQECYTNSDYEKLCKEEKQGAGSDDEEEDQSPSNTDGVPHAPTPTSGRKRPSKGADGESAPKRTRGGTSKLSTAVEINGTNGAQSINGINGSNGDYAQAATATDPSTHQMDHAAPEGSHIGANLRRLTAGAPLAEVMRFAREVCHDWEASEEHHHHPS